MNESAVLLPGTKDCFRGLCSVSGISTLIGHVDSSSPDLAFCLALVYSTDYGVRNIKIRFCSSSGFHSFQFFSSNKFGHGLPVFCDQRLSFRALKTSSILSTPASQDATDSRCHDRTCIHEPSRSPVLGFCTYKAVLVLSLSFTF